MLLSPLSLTWWLVACASTPDSPVVRQTAFLIDEAGRVVEQTDLLLGLSTRWTFAWDSDGKLVERRTAHQITRYDYDAKGRLRRIEDPPLVVRLSYGTVDRIERDFDGDGTPEHVQEVAYRDGGLWTITQAPQGQPPIVREYAQPVPDRVEVVERVGRRAYASWDCRYDAGRLVRMAYDSDADGRPDGTTTWTRDARGWPLQAISDTGWHRTWTYDGDGRLVRVESFRRTRLEETTDYRWTSAVGGTVPAIRVPEQGFGPMEPPAFPHECPDGLSELSAPN